MNRFFKIFVFIILTSLQVTAQRQSDFTQYMFNGLLINPAYAGIHEALNVTGLYRRQWVGFNGAPVTLNFSAHTALKNRHYNTGLLIENDRAGLYSRTKAAGAFAYRFPAFRGKLSLGIQAGIAAQTYNWQSVRLTEPDDPVYPGVASRELQAEASTGIYYQHKKFFVGASAQNILNNDLSVYLASAGALVPISSEITMKPVTLVRHAGNSGTEWNVSSTFYYQEVAGAGAGYTFGNCWLAYLDLRLNGQLNLGYGYQRQLNRLGTYTAGSHEVMIRYLFRYRIKATNPRYF